MKYLANTFSPLMIQDGKFLGMPISLAQAKALAKDAKSVVGHEVTATVLSALLGVSVAFNRENLAVVPGDQIVCVIPKFRANEAREFTFEEVSAAGFQAFLVEVSSAPKPEVEEAGKPVKWTWNDGMGSRSRHPRCLVVDANGDIFKFTGSDIPGVVKVLGSDYNKNGKWSNSTYRCVSPKGTISVSWKQDWDTGETFPQDSWEQAFEWLKAQAPQANRESFEKIVRKEWEKAAAKFDENAQALQEMGA